MKTIESPLNKDTLLQLRIHKYGSPVLRKRAKALKEITEKERAIFEEMLKIMYKNGGIGLAGPQLGINKQMIVVDAGESPVMLANPRILKRQGRDILEEGCLSLPDITVEVKRAKKILVEGLNQYNKKIKFQAQDILARAILHETDHLRGRLIIDYVSFSDRLHLKNKLKEISRKEKNERMLK